MNNYKVADILHFGIYRFTDDLDSKLGPRFALVIIPSKLTAFENNLYCSVITTQKPRSFDYFLKLKKSNYNCFNQDCIVCFNRMDLCSLEDLSKGKQPKSTLDQGDMQKSFKKLKKMLYSSRHSQLLDKFLRAVTIREWKNALGGI